MKDGIVGKVVLITGASSGIGWETALAFAERGALVAACARRADKLAELSRKLRSLEADCLDIQCDVSRREDVAKAVRAVISKWGRLDILVNNAGVNSNLTFENMPVEEAERLVRTNLLGPIYLIKEILPEMRRQGGGHIVNVASVAGIRGMPYMTVYSGTKFGLVGLTEALRAEMFGSGITFTAFCPGTVDTAMAETALKDPTVARLTRAKSARGTALKIVKAAERRSPEVVYAEVPGFVFKLGKLLPGTMDRVLHSVYQKFQHVFPQTPTQTAGR